MPCLEQLERITSESLNMAFRRWREGKLAPTELLALSLWYSADGERGRDLLLYNWVQTKVLQRVAFYTPLFVSAFNDDTQDAENTLQQFGAAVERLNEQGTADGVAYAALYFRWIIPQAMPPSRIATAANLSERHLRRLVEYATGRLAAQLRQAVFEACREQQEPPAM